MKYRLERYHRNEPFQSGLSVQSLNKLDTSIYQYECPDCSKKFKRVCSLVRHLQNHENVRAFKCGKCNKQLVRHSALSKHQCTHASTRKKSAHQLHKDFKIYSSRINLVRIATYRCIDCLRVFEYQHLLCRHRAICCKPCSQKRPREEDESGPCKKFALDIQENGEELESNTQLFP